MAKNRKIFKQNQEGIVPIVVTMIIMIVLTLIVTGFAQLARREQRESLDRQLSTQSFYAAETGVNDARKAIADGFVIDKTDCGPLTGTIPTGGNALTDNKVDGATGVISYSCLLITQKISDLRYQNVSSTSSTVVPLNPSVLLDSVSFKWKAKSGSTSATSSLGIFPPVATWGDKVGILRVDLIPVGPAGGTFSASSLQTGTFTAFFQPISQNTGAGGSASYTTALGSQGQIIGVDCNPSGVCEAKIVGLPTGAVNNYYVRVKSLYTTSEVTICGNLCNGVVTFQGAQADIDSTGRASDVLKRIKVRVNDVSSLGNTKSLPEFALDSSEDICKRLSVYPGGGDIGGCTP